MPATSAAQRAFMAAELARLVHGKKRKTKLNKKQLEEYVHTPGKLPKHHTKKGGK